MLEQAKEAAAKLAELMIELSESESPAHPDEAGLGDQLKIATATLQEMGPKRQLAPFRRMRSEQWPLAYCGRKSQ